jgi:DNA polymerase
MKEQLRQLIRDLRENILYAQSLGIQDLWFDGLRLSEAPNKTEFRLRIDSLIDSKANLSSDKREVIISELLEQLRPSNLNNTLKESEITTHGETLSKQDKFENVERISEIDSEIKNISGQVKPAVSLFSNVGFYSEADTIDKIRSDIGDCKRCPLHQGRTQIVHSVGNTNARLMFVGEAPGADEDRLGEPFVGRAGQLLTKIIEAMGLKREEVFIGNINRCRPPGNRQPNPEEAKICREFLIREIFVVRPLCIVVLGNTACQYLLNTKSPITKIRGQFQDFFGIKVMPTFHPAYLLRDPSKKREVWEDMKKVRDYLESLK